MNKPRSNLPGLPGVYFFKDSKKKVIYIGKAKNIKNRINSYFASNLAPKTARMVSGAMEVTYLIVNSEFEALLLEAKLVKKYNPKWNIQLKDDKSPLYIGITQEDLPRIKTYRQTDLEKERLKNIWGPFIDATSAKKVLRLLKKVFSFCDHRPGSRPCVNSEIGLCNPCSSLAAGSQDEILRRLYFLNIRRVRGILNGQIRVIRSNLKKEVKTLARLEKFEQARELNRKIEMLDYITTPVIDVGEYVKNPNIISEIRRREMKDLKSILMKYFPNIKTKRVECFDIAHLSGSFSTASMVTFIDGESEKSYYRHFRVRLGGNSDTGSLKEVVLRRKRYFKSWGRPDLIIVDGGKPQVSVISEIVRETPVVGIAKREEKLVIKSDNKFHEHILPKGPARNFVQRIRDEAHRFARRYHHMLISKAIVQG
ncbi:MAG: Excinuclease ABC C subunit domain protein [Candidatus Woesebacteria bacterium GW2011_GWB1_43_14]|uniref:Excinuclease ABC C subunit domain protein n=1 Tax=Candidatus Woesebacteria bacterium GW2011_GWB1_43_14 TaxID=1618578 RepID=A0A0G1FQ09_9BACT|nr:MAG: Excinuclease ABC C subunit domain protein [Candidatus Woesebacteria bacterium GW2011_GWA1_39_11b]KKS77593.1 MAG: excinuclease ABC C subunit domain protein, excinuclease ABC subunit C [Candidatus Woesebacteria bacterium GW2011_GWC1_42_9]KKS97096.1 MAG: Excinuclease ABC C subunit domain protein [Candidatus Woesebacteria bacterium GW2011_GWB1_43_14]